MPIARLPHDLIRPRAQRAVAACERCNNLITVAAFPRETRAVRWCARCRLTTTHLIRPRPPAEPT